MYVLTWKGRKCNIHLVERKQAGSNYKVIVMNSTGRSAVGPQLSSVTKTSAFEHVGGLMGNTLTFSDHMHRSDYIRNMNNAITHTVTKRNLL